MENIQLNVAHHGPEALSSNNLFDWEKNLILNQENKASAMDEDEKEDSLVDLMLCDSNSRLIATGLTRSSCSG